MADTTKLNYHLFFIFQLKTKENPVAFHYTSASSKDALRYDIDEIQSVYEELQDICKGKLNFSIRHRLGEIKDMEKVGLYRSLPELKKLLEKELTSVPYGELPAPSIARKGNHLVLGIYANGELKYNIVANEHVMHNYVYNTCFRFGRLIYTDGIRTYDGCIKPEYLKSYDEKAEQFCHGMEKISTVCPTIPYS